jgi:hypothetical protein
MVWENLHIGCLVSEGREELKMSNLKEFDNWFGDLWTNTIRKEGKEGIIDREADIVCSLYHHARSHSNRWRLRCELKAFDPVKELDEGEKTSIRTVGDMEYSSWVDEAVRRRIDLEVRFPNGEVLPIEVKTFWMTGTKGITKDLENLRLRMMNPHIKVAGCLYCMIGFGGDFDVEKDPKGEFFASKILEMSSQPDYKWTRGALRVAHGSPFEEHEWGYFKV